MKNLKLQSNNQKIKLWKLRFAEAGAIENLHQDLQGPDSNGSYINPELNAFSKKILVKCDQNLSYDEIIIKLHSI